MSRGPRATERCGASEADSYRECAFPARPDHLESQVAILSSSRQQPLWAGVLPVALTGNTSPGSADGRQESWGNSFPQGAASFSDRKPR